MSDPTIELRQQDGAYAVLLDGQSVAWLSLRPSPPHADQSQVVAGLTEQLRRAHDAIAAREADLAAARDEIDWRGTEMGRLSTQAERLRKEAEGSAAECKRAQAEAAEARGHLADAWGQVAQLRSERDSFRAAASRVNDELEALRAADSTRPAIVAGDAAYAEVIRDVLAFLHHNGMHPAADAVRRQWPSSDMANDTANDTANAAAMTAGR